MTIELDYFEYANDGAAQAAYVTNGAYVSATGFNTGFSTNTTLYNEAGDAGGGQKVSQGFQVQSTITCVAVRIYLRKDGLPVDNLILRIETDAAGEPSGDLVHANATQFVSGGDVPGGFAYVTFTFDASFSLTLDTQYHAVLSRSGAKDPFKSYIIGLAGAGGYDYGVAMNGGEDPFNWTTLAPADCLFNIYSSVKVLQCYSEDTIKVQGSYSLKGLAAITDSLNNTLTRTVDPPIDLSGQGELFVWARSDRTSKTIEVQLHDAGGTTTTIDIDVAVADTWQEIEVDISGVADADKDAIDQIIVKIIDADVANTFYVDWAYTELGIADFPVTRLRKDVIHGYNCFMHQYVTASREGLTPLKLPDGTVF